MTKMRINTMNKRVIYIAGCDKWVSLGQYVAQIKRVKANLSRIFKSGLTCWWPCTGHEIMQQFRVGMQERINHAIPYIQRGL